MNNAPTEDYQVRRGVPVSLDGLEPAVIPVSFEVNILDDVTKRTMLINILIKFGVATKSYPILENSTQGMI